MLTKFKMLLQLLRKVSVRGNRGYRKEKGNLIDENKLCETQYAELKILMEEMNSKYEDICTWNKMMCTETKGLNKKNEVVKSAIHASGKE